jgi:alkanesulfonate monooxygenase SsuD/methylene tetrahydromethanopterin reductase-like flavin-dependent oxidoreductase (luciferase family)
MSGPAIEPSVAPMGPGSISLRLYPHNELSATEIVDHLCTMAAGAADVGFDGVMTSEHHGGFAGYLPNPLQVTGFQLSAMARGWAAASPVLLPLRPVALLAEEVAWLDARFPGRVGIGVGPGSLPLDFEVMDAELDDAVPRFKRDLPRLAAMLRGEELGQLGGDRALGALASARRSIPMVSTAMSPAAARRAATCGVGVIYDGASVVERLRRLSDAHAESGGTGPRVLVRRVWLGEPPTAAFDAQFDVYRGYTPAERQDHWRGSGWMTGDDAEAMATELVSTLTASGATCLNLRIHAPGVDPDAAQEQIGTLGRELLPRMRSLLAGPPPR